MYKIAVIGDYDSIYGFATLGLSICPVKTREDARKKLKQLADGQYGIIYITEAVAAQIEEEIEQYRENTLPAIIQIPGVSGNTGAGKFVQINFYWLPGRQCQCRSPKRQRLCRLPPERPCVQPCLCLLRRRLQ